MEVVVVVKFTLHNIESKGEPVVSETGMTIVVDEDVLLCVFSCEQGVVGCIYSRV